jgi:hypothetical protein
MNAIALDFQPADDTSPLLDSAEVLLSCPCRRGQCTDLEPCGGHAGIYEKACRHASLQNAHERRLLKLMVWYLSAPAHSRAEWLLGLLVSVQYQKDATRAEWAMNKGCEIVFGMKWENQ